MSFHVYVANEGGKDNPLNHEDFIAAAKKCEKLTIHQVVKRNGKQNLEIYLKGKRNKYLWFTPYGLIHTQNPNEEMMHILFFLAQELNAGVYNESFKPFSSFEDWERKTRHSRKMGAIQMKVERRRKIKSIVFFVMFASLCFLAGWLLGEYKIF